MACDNKEVAGIVGSVSRQAGALAGTSVVVSKKLAGCGVQSAISVTNWLKRPLQGFSSPSSRTSISTANTPALQSSEERETERKKAAKSLIAALESDLATARRQLKEAQTMSEKARSESVSRRSKQKKEKESLIAGLKQPRAEANKVVSQEVEVTTQMTTPESDLSADGNQVGKSGDEGKDAKSRSPYNLTVVETEAPAEPSNVVEEEAAAISDEKEVERTIEIGPTQLEEEVNIETEEQPSQSIVEAKAPCPPMVVADDVQAASFSNATDHIIFARALSDMASRDAAARADAVKTIAAIRHELSLKAIIAHMASESSTLVRQECVKALASLEMKEGLAAVDDALTDRSGSVRLAAVWALYRLLGVESAPKLIRMFCDENEEVRRRATTCIGWLGQPELAVKLLPLLDDKSTSVRRAAVEAIGNLGNQHVISSLIEHLSDPVESIRSSVLIAIETITGKKMSKSIPKDEAEFEHVIARWREWWKEELLA